MSRTFLASRIALQAFIDCTVGIAVGKLVWYAFGVASKQGNQARQQATKQSWQVVPKRPALYLAGKRDNMIISIKRKEVYGNRLIYVCDKTHAEILRGLTGKKTVSEGDLKYLTMLGITIRDIDQEIKQLMEA